MLTGQFDKPFTPLGQRPDCLQKIYGRQFITSAAQGGSWKVKTPTGEMLGLLVSPPITGSTDQIDMIGAGYFGCAAMGPEAGRNRHVR